MFGALKPREARTKVLVPCRLNHGGQWMDACVRNVSSRGMLVETPAPPRVGAYVDIRRGSLVIIARVVWARGPTFGVRTQDRIEVSALVNEPRLDRAPTRDVERARSDRRVNDRATAVRRAGERAEQSKRFAAMAQFLMIALVGATIAGFAAKLAYASLAAPVSSIEAALGGARGG